MLQQKNGEGKEIERDRTRELEVCGVWRKTVSAETVQANRPVGGVVLMSEIDERTNQYILYLKCGKCKKNTRHLYQGQLPDNDILFKCLECKEVYRWKKQTLYSMPAEELF